VISLIDAALRIVQEARKARHRVSGIPTTLDNVSKHLDSLEKSLTLVRGERSLQNLAIEQQLQTITQVAEELKRFYDELSLVQQRSSSSKFIRSLRMGDREEKSLEGILKRLDTAKDDLTIRILVAHVGIVGNFQDGMRVAYNELAKTNANVHRVLNVNMALWERIQNRDRALGKYSMICGNLSNYEQMEQSLFPLPTSSLLKHLASTHPLKQYRTRYMATKALPML
jgi:hypothetical protein